VGLAGKTICINCKHPGDLNDKRIGATIWGDKIEHRHISDKGLMEAVKDNPVDLYVQYLVKYIEDIEYLSIAEGKEVIERMDVEGRDAEIRTFQLAAITYSDIFQSADKRERALLQCLIKKIHNICHLIEGMQDPRA
jgi:hypothetical protein